jgi:DNA polymerase-1
LIPRAAQLIGITIALSENEAVYIPLGHKEVANNCDLSAVLNCLKIIIENPDITKIGHDLKYDYQVFKNYGIHLNGITFDTMIAAYLLDPGKRTFELEVLVSEWLEMDTTLLSQIVNEKKGNTIADLAVHDAACYAAEMVCLPFLLKKKLEIALAEKKCQKLFAEIEMPLVHVLADLEWQGMLIDTVLLESLSKEYSASLSALSQEVYLLAGEQLNLNSPKQIGEILFDKLHLPAPKKTKSGTHSTSVDILEKLAPEYPIVQKILDCREVQKLLSTYIDALPQQILVQSGRVHSSFNQTVAATGRLSSTNPNLQNIPVRTDGSKRIRQAFIAKPGFLLVSADYSQIELRILAHLSKDPFLIQAFENDQDIHTQTASAIYGTFPEFVTPEMRRTAKTINFGLMYGMGPINLSRQLGISFGEAKIFIDKYFEQFPTIKNFMDSTIKDARVLGYTQTLLGRKRYHPEINSQNRTIREAAERTAINTPVQGTAADIIKIAMINIHNELDKLYCDARMLLQVHDELVFEVPQSQSEGFHNWIINKMSTAYKLIVPLKVDGGIGKNWSEAH